MNLTISFHDQKPSEDVAWRARRAVAFALDRFEDRIREVVLRIADVNGPRGGRDQRCTLALAVAGGGSIVLEDQDESAERCVHRLARRAARVLSRLKSMRVKRRREGR